MALSLIDCIKLKIKCLSQQKQGSNNGSKKLMQTQTTNKKSLRSKMLGIKTPFQKSQLNPKTIPKQNHNRSYEETINFDSYFQEIGGGELTTTNKKASKPLNNQITSNRNLHTPVSKTRNLHFTSVSNTNNLNLPHQNINFNTCQSSIRKENKVSNSGNSQDTKEKNSGNSSDKQKLLTNTTNKTQNKKFHYNNSRTENTKKQNNSEIKKSKLNNKTPEIVKKLEPNFNKIKKKENIENANNNSINEDNNNLLNANSMKKTISTQNQNTIASPTIYNDNINNESNSLLHTSISQELISLNFVNESNNLIDDNNMDMDSLDAFTQTKNDFNLLYTNEYIKMIQDDLLKLELELLIEKMFEIVSCYHTQLSNEKIIYGKVSRLYKECSQKFLLLNKQYSKLQHQKEKFQISKQNLHFISGNNIKNSQNLLSVNKEEINMFNLLIKPKKNDTSFLKEIFSTIVTKHKYFILENCDEKEIEFLQKGSYLKTKKKEKSSVEVPMLKGIEYLNERSSLGTDSAIINGSKTMREKDRQTFLKRLTVPKTLNGKKKK